MSAPEAGGNGHDRRNALFTLMSFALAVVSIPTFCMCYLTTAMGRFVLLRLLKSMYPDLEFIKSVSIRSAMDTPENTGYIVVLLRVIGQFDIELMKHTIQTDIVDKYDRVSGRLCFPHLRCSLTKKWLRYAWTKPSKFSIDDHVIGLPADMAVSEDDVMQRVNDIIATSMPAELPQWQITMIPVRGDDAFYLLVRIHHLYASEDGVGLSDLLLLRPEDGRDGVKPSDPPPPPAQHQQQQQHQQHQHHQDADSIQNILSTVYQAPTALPRLAEHVSEICANAWNELVSAYDPVGGNPKAQQPARPNALTLAATVLIAAAAAARRDGHRDRRPRFAHRLRRELARRGVRPGYACRCAANTLHPATVASAAWWLLVNCALRVPIAVLLAARNASACVYWTYVVLYSASEVAYLARLIYLAPGTVIRELVLPFFGGCGGVDDGCYDGRGLAAAAAAVATSVGGAGGAGGGRGGRKCVSWSRPIDLDVVGTIHDNTGAATCEIQLSMLSVALQECVAEAGVRLPCDKKAATVMTTTRFVSKDNLLQLNNRHAVTNGLLALPLPVDGAAAAPGGTGRPCSDPMYSLHMMQECLQEAIGSQTALYIASMWQIDHSLATSFLPSPLVSYGLRRLSKKYPLTVTYVEEHKLDRKRRRLLWGQEVDAILYWRPPQANVCLSLSIINYGGNLRLAVMADKKMAPQCNEIVSKYEGNIPAFVTAAENYAKIVNTSD